MTEREMTAIIENVSYDILEFIRANEYVSYGDIYSRVFNAYHAAVAEAPRNGRTVLIKYLPVNADYKAQGRCLAQAGWCPGDFFWTGSEMIPKENVYGWWPLDLFQAPETQEDG